MESPVMSLGSSEALATLGAAGAAAAYSIPPVFTELFELCKYDDGYQEWKEISRWIKYEEAVEEAGNRWSKPHVSTPSLVGWLEFRRSLRDGLVLIDLDAKDFTHITEIASSLLVDKGDVSQEVGNRLKELWNFKHRHQFEGPRKVEGNLTRAIKDLLVQKLEHKAASSGLRLSQQQQQQHSSRPESRRGSFGHKNNLDADEFVESSSSRALRMDDGKVNIALTKKIDSSSEAAVILVGAVGFLEKPVSVLVRLANPLVLNDMPEVDIPTRFLYFYTGPHPTQQSGVPEAAAAALWGKKKDPAATSSSSSSDNRGLQANLGVALATAITDRQFACALYNAKTEDEIMDALDAYTGGLKLLPSDYDAESNKIEPPTKSGARMKLEEDEDIDEDRRMREQSGLVRSGRLFGGLMQDIRRKRRFYLSDFLQGLHPQCISSFLFLYFACLAPIIAFGALLGKATENRIATIESLMSGVISGVLFGLFAGQPLIILGSTGPVYVFEKILYQICTDQNWDYLSLRLWIGLWVGVILILLVALDASALVCYITRFTEELFATLIAFIFIVNAFKNLVHIADDFKFVPTGDDISCVCEPFNETFPEDTTIVWQNLTKWDCEENRGRTVGENCDFEPNVFLMSVILFAGTFAIAFSLKNFRNTGYLPSNIRNFFSDFAVIIAILLMTGIAHFAGTRTPALVVPDSFAPTYEDRKWFIAHALIVADHLLTNPWWVDVFLAPVLALLATILIFMDQQITAVIVNRKEHKLKKGGGYHLDLLVLAVIVIICSVFGLPWFVAATVLSINHIQSLTKESESSAPGEKPQFLGIREQRVTAVLIAICIGLSIFITPILRLIPMPVLYGVFLFMGVSSLKGLQFFDRLLLLFIPRKYQPDYVFLKYVPLYRAHLFTFFQLTALILLWVIKNDATTSISFPVMLVVICGIRKFMECVFSRHELRVLDDLLPESSSKKRRHGGGIFNRVDVAYEMEQAKKKEEEEEAEKVRLLQEEARNRAMGAELDDYGRVDLKAKNRQLLDLVKAGRASSRSNSTLGFPGGGGGASAAAREKYNRAYGRMSESETMNPLQYNPALMMRGGGGEVRAEKKVVFVKLSDQDIFIPMNVNTCTSSGLLRLLEAKFPAHIRAPNVASVFQKNKKNMIFHLDDDMVEMIEPGQVFDVETSESKDFPGKIDVMMREVDMDS